MAPDLPESFEASGRPSACSASSAQVPSPAPTIPDYELLRRIGRGAYGEVWLARNLTGSFVAVKVVTRAAFEDDRPFERELEGIKRFEPISRLDPGQVAILHVGRGEGFFYYVMELADDSSTGRGVRSAESERPSRIADSHIAFVLPNSAPSHSTLRAPYSYVARTLREELRQKGRLPVGDCVEIGLGLASALSYLHSHGLVHRDIKPSNIVFVHGVPKLADIGLVASVDATRSFVGTAGYLPPEGPGKPVGDLYSLGKVLYEISVGRDRQDFPALPEKWEEFADTEGILELNAIMLKACAHDPRERYQTAQEMRNDLELLQRGKSVRSGRRAAKRWRSARLAAGWLAGVTLTLVLVALANHARLPATAPYVEKLSTNDQANYFYNLGQTYLDKLRGTNFQIAAENFQRAIAADTNFAQAYAALATVYSWSDGEWNPDWRLFPKARDTALQALSLDKALARPHSVLGCYYALIEWRWAEAERECKHAIAISPNDASCHLTYAEVLRMTGRSDAALAELNKAKALDARSLAINSRLADFLNDTKQFRKALTQLEQVVALNPNMSVAYIRYYALSGLGQYALAIEAERSFRSSMGESQNELAWQIERLTRCWETEGAKGYWRAKLQNAEENKETYAQAYSHAQLGHTNEALICLEELLKVRSTELTFSAMTDWRLDPVRPDKRFHDVLKTMHLE